MKLYSAPTSPYARKILILLHETGLLKDVEVLGASGTPLDPGTMPVAQNPLGKIPCLERPDGPALYDSRVITRYLDDMAGGRFYPKGGRLWETLTLEATADGICDAAILMVYETRLRPEAMRMPEIESGQWAKIARSLDALEGRWTPFLAGPFCMGQVALAAALGYLDLRHSARGWRTGHPQLAKWHDGVAARPSVAATAPPAA